MNKNLNFKKVVSLTAAVAMTVTMLAGCGSSNEQAAQSSGQAQTTTSTAAGSTAAGSTSQTGALKGEITQWVWGDYEKKGAVDFNKTYPDIKVNYVMVPQNDYVKKLQTTAASNGDMPDVANLEMTARGSLANLDIWEKLDAAPYNLNKDDLVPFAIPISQNKKGDIVCVQIDNCVGGYAYNRELAKKYFGTDDPAELEKVLTNWDVFVQKGKEISEKSGGKNFLFAGSDDAYYALIGLYTKEPWVQDKKLNLDTTVLPTMKYIEQLIKDKALGKYVMWTPAWNSSFASNTVVFYAAPTWFVPFVMKANDKDANSKYGLITPPNGGYSWGGTAYGIPKESKNKELAWTYIKWFTMSREGSEGFFRTQGTPTLYSKVYDTGLYTNDANKDPYFGGQNIMQKYMEIAKNPNTQTRPMTEYDAGIYDSIVVALRAMDTGLSADQALPKLKADIIKKFPELQQ